MEDFVTNSQLLALLEAIKIISDLADTKENFKKYIDQVKGEIKKPAETSTTQAG